MVPMPVCIKSTREPDCQIPPSAELSQPIEITASAGTMSQAAGSHHIESQDALTRGKRPALRPPELHVVLLRSHVAAMLSSQRANQMITSASLIKLLGTHSCVTGACC